MIIHDKGSTLPRISTAGIDVIEHKPSEAPQALKDLVISTYTARAEKTFRTFLRG